MRPKLVIDTIKTIKVSLFRSRVIAVNFFFPTSLTYLMIKKILAIVYNLQLNS